MYRLCSHVENSPLVDFSFHCVIKINLIWTVSDSLTQTFLVALTKTQKENARICGRKQPGNLDPFGWMSGDLRDNPPPLFPRLVPINLRQVRSSPARDLSPVTTVT